MNYEPAFYEITRSPSLPIFGYFRHGKHVHECVCMCMWGASLVAQMVKNLPAVQETRVRSLGQEDPLEEGMATHSSTLAWRIPWTEEPVGLQSMGSQKSQARLKQLRTSMCGCEVRPKSIKFQRNFRPDILLPSGGVLWPMNSNCRQKLLYFPNLQRRLKNFM